MDSTAQNAFAVDVTRMAKLAFGDETRRVKSALSFWLLNSELHCVACYRFGQAAREIRRRNKLVGSAMLAVYKIWNRWVTHFHHTIIHPGARIGPGFLLMHRHGVLIGPSEIGANVVVHQNVTIGQRVAGGDQTMPRIGDNVWIGPGAIISGAITVGDGATISAGAVLSKSVLPRTLVAGNPARVIANDYDNSRMLNIPEAKGKSS